MGARVSDAIGQRPTNIPAVDLAYFAGLFDGEGCIMHDGSPRVSVTSCWPHHLLWLANEFGYGRFRQLYAKKGNRRTAFRWEANGQNALDFLKTIRPYLREKAHQADMLVQLTEYPLDTANRERLEGQLKKHKRLDYGST